MTVAELRDRLTNVVAAYDPDCSDVELVGFAEALFDAAGNILTTEYTTEAGE